MNNEYQLCPKCKGQGIVSKPPWIPGDVDTWTDSCTGGGYTCDLCNGAKVILKPEFKMRIEEVYVQEEPYRLIQDDWTIEYLEPLTFITSEYIID